MIWVTGVSEQHIEKKHTYNNIVMITPFYSFNHKIYDFYSLEVSDLEISQWQDTSCEIPFIATLYSWLNNGKNIIITTFDPMICPLPVVKYSNVLKGIE
jgi:hypothetical protein